MVGLPNMIDCLITNMVAGQSGDEADTLKTIISGRAERAEVMPGASCERPSLLRRSALCCFSTYGPFGTGLRAGRVSDRSGLRELKIGLKWLPVRTITNPHPAARIRPWQGTVLPLTDATRHSDLSAHCAGLAPGRTSQTRRPSDQTSWSDPLVRRGRGARRNTAPWDPHAEHRPKVRGDRALSDGPQWACDWRVGTRPL